MPKRLQEGRDLREFGQNLCRTARRGPVHRELIRPETEKGCKKAFRIRSESSWAKPLSDSKMQSLMEGSLLDILSGSLMQSLTDSFSKLGHRRTLLGFS